MVKQNGPAPFSREAVRGDQTIPFAAPSPYVGRDGVGGRWPTGGAVISSS
jgi:hypothetical protein